MNYRHPKVTGGESSHQRFFTILDPAIEKDSAKNITLMITTNASKFVKRILDKLQHLKSRTYSKCRRPCAVYDYIRYLYLGSVERQNERTV